MSVDIHTMIVNQVQKDAIALAERERLIRQIAKTRSVERPVRREWMERLGDQMVAWGQDLKTRSVRA
jgi:hypothetical protein